MEDFEKQLQDIAGKKNVFKNEPMSKHTSFKIGGIADYYIVVNSVQELKNVLKIAESNKIPITIPVIVNISKQNNCS